jgi:hypothetical protein
VPKKLAEPGMTTKVRVLPGGWFAERGLRPWARFSRDTGAVFSAGFAAIVIGSGNPFATIAFTVAVVVAWAWLATISVWFYRHVGEIPTMHEVDR